VQTSDSQRGEVVLALRPDVVATVLEDGAVLLDLESKYFYALNGSGWAIAQLFEAAATMESVEERARAWGAPQDDAVRRFVEQLRDHGLLEAAAEAGETVEASTVDAPEPWVSPTVEQQPEPLQQVIVSAFDPSIPLAE
jgi:hypothetical protein